MATDFAAVVVFNISWYNICHFLFKASTYNILYIAFQSGTQLPNFAMQQSSGCLWLFSNLPSLHQGHLD